TLPSGSAGCQLGVQPREKHPHPLPPLRRRERFRHALTAGSAGMGCLPLFRSAASNGACSICTSCSTATRKSSRLHIGASPKGPLLLLTGLLREVRRQRPALVSVEDLCPALAKPRCAGKNDLAVETHEHVHAGRQRTFAAGLRIPDGEEPGTLD